jgi:recombinational DNA repair ATPase RecF
VLSSPTLSQRENKQSRLGEIEERLELLRRDTIRLQGELDELEVLDDKIEEKNAEREELVLKKEHSEYRLHILEATARMLETAKESMQSSYLIPMRKSFDALLTELCEKEAGEVTLDASFKLSCKHRGVSHTVDAMSRGERDLYLLISRLAIVDTLYPEGMLPPIFLDDPFVAFDDARVDKALTYLNALAKTRQIIYLTCSSARAR